MDTSSQGTQPETQPTQPVGWSKRAMETIRKDLATLAGVPAFDARHPELKPDAIAIAGPFESSEKAAHRVLEWAFKQPGGSFMVHLNGTYTAIKSRGRQFKVRCKNVKKHKCQFKLVYEQADDDRYHLQNANLSHGDGCRKPDATPAENLAAGTFRVPPELLETGVQMKSANMSTATVNSFMLHQAGLAGLDVTWTWHHLDRALARELEKLPGGVPGRGHDAPEADGWEAGEVTENPADAGPRVPPKTDRWRCIATACKALCDVGKRSKNAYLDVMDAVERVHRELDRKHSKPAERADKGGVDPVTGELVLNPSQPKHGKGKRGTKRAKGAHGA